MDSACRSCMISLSSRLCHARDAAISRLLACGPISLQPACCQNLECPQPPPTLHAAVPHWMAFWLSCCLSHVCFLELHAACKLPVWAHLKQFVSLQEMLYLSQQALSLALADLSLTLETRCCRIKNHIFWWPQSKYRVATSCRDCRMADKVYNMVTADMAKNAAWYWLNNSAFVRATSYASIATQACE